MLFRSRDIARGLRCLIVIKKATCFYDLKIVPQFWREKNSKFWREKKSEKNICFDAEVLLSPIVPNRAKKYILLRDVRIINSKF